MAVMINAWEQAASVALPLREAALRRDGVRQAETYWESAKCLAVTSSVAGLTVRADSWCGHRLIVDVLGHKGEAAAALGSPIDVLVDNAVQAGRMSALPALAALDRGSVYPVTPTVNAGDDDDDGKECARSLLSRLRELATRGRVDCVLAWAQRRASRVGYCSCHDPIHDYTSLWFGLGLTAGVAGISVSGPIWDRMWPDPDRLWERLRHRLDRLCAPACSQDPGKLPLVLSGRAMGMILEGCWTMFSNPPAWCLLGNELAGPCLSLADDPLDCRFPATAPFDGEGTPSTHNPLISEGRVAGGLSCRSRPPKDGSPPAANGMRDNYWSGSRCAPTNLVVTAGTGDPHSMVSGQTLWIDSFVVRGPASFDRDTATVRGTINGAVMNNGQVPGAVRSLNVSCSLTDILRGVVAVGPEVECYVGGVVAASPMIRVEPQKGCWW